MKIGLVGYFGYGNYGDELFLRIWRNLFGYENTQVIYPGDDLSNIDKIVIGGGDIIFPSLMNNNYFREEFLKKDVYVYGVGVPIESKENKEEIDKFRDFLSKVKYISVRDEASYNWLKGKAIDAHIVEDMAWSFENTVKLTKPKDGIKTIGITIRQHPRFSMDDYLKVCINIVNKGNRVLLIPLQESYCQTRDLHVVLKERLVNSLYYTPCNITNFALDIEHKWALIQNLDGYITMALHGAITSLHAGIPTIMLGTDNKFKQITVKTECPLAETYNAFLSQKLEIDNDMKTKIERIKHKSKEDLLKFKEIVLCK